MHAETKLTSPVLLIARHPVLWSVGACLIAVLAIHAPTTLSLVSTWWRSETFTHGFAIIPIFFYLVWIRRGELENEPVRPHAAGVVALGLCGLIWLAGSAASALGVMQFAVIAMVPAAVLAVLGMRWLRVLAFPLAFLFFAVPFGTFLVPTLIEWTASFTVRALQLTGIPVRRMGDALIIPSGTWLVVEACSGVRYLIASVMIGVLGAWHMYRTPWRRMAFIAASAAVPLVANGLRAYLIVLLGHLSGNRIAVGVDHIIYGWVFFGIALYVLFRLGRLWKEPDSVATVPAPVDRPSPGLTRSWRPTRVLVALLAVAPWPVFAAVMASRVDTRPVEIAEIAANSRWEALPGEVPAWAPVVIGARAGLARSYSHNGVVVTLNVSVFRNQVQGAEMISALNNILTTDQGYRWRTLASHRVVVNDALEVRESVLQDGQQRITVWDWYWMDGSTTPSATRSKLNLALASASGRSDTSAWVTISTSTTPDDPSAGAAQALAAFVDEMGPALERSLEETVAR